MLSAWCNPILDLTHDEFIDIYRSQSTSDWLLSIMSGNLKSNTHGFFTDRIERHQIRTNRWIRVIRSGPE